MRISTKIISGYATLIVFMLGLLAFQVFTVHRMQSTITKLSDVNFQTAETALQMMRDLDQVDLFTQKSFASADPSNAERLGEYRDLFEAGLRKVESYGRTQAVQAEIGRLSRFWSSFSDELARQRLAARSQSGLEVPGVLVDLIAQLKDQTENVYEAAGAELQSEVKAFDQAGRMVGIVSWIVAGITLLLGASVSVFILQSVVSPLKQLTQGTRAIAEGKFFYRLDTTRRDELGELAKDFNTITRRLSELDRGSGLQPGHVTETKSNG
jgi:methyl-accepting chemotaxis protein